MSLYVVAVNPGVQIFNKDHNSEMWPKDSQKADFPFFPIPLKNKTAFTQSQTNSMPMP